MSHTRMTTLFFFGFFFFVVVLFFSIFSFGVISPACVRFLVSAL